MEMGKKRFTRISARILCMESVGAKPCKRLSLPPASGDLTLHEELPQSPSLPECLLLLGVAGSRGGVSSESAIGAM